MIKSERRRFYNSAHWKRTRALQLARSPICEDCRASGRTTMATVVDHRKSLASGGSRDDPANLRSLCVPHHSSKTRRVDVGGQADVRPLSREIDPNTGLSTDPQHFWNNGLEDPFGDADLARQNAAKAAGESEGTTKAMTPTAGMSPRPSPKLTFAPATPPPAPTTAPSKPRDKARDKPRDVLATVKTTDDPTPTDAKRREWLNSETWAGWSRRA